GGFMPFIRRSRPQHSACGRVGLPCLAAVVLLAAPVVVLEVEPPSQQAGPSIERETRSKLDRDVAKIRKATEKFKSLDEAVKEGYARDVAHCLANPPEGAMGYHHQNDALLDDRLELER